MLIAIVFIRKNLFIEGSLPGLLFTFTIFLFACGSSSSTTTTSSHVGLSDSIINQAKEIWANEKDIDVPFFLDSMYKKISTPDLIDKWVKYNFLCKFYLEYPQNVPKARVYTDSMRFVLRGLENTYKNQYAHTLFNQGDVLMAEKKYSEAFNCYYDGRTYAEENLDTCEIANFTGRLAMVKYRQLHFREAIPYFKKALKENRTCQYHNSYENSLMFPQSWLCTLALCYEQLTIQDSAGFCLKNALDLVTMQTPDFPNYNVAIKNMRSSILSDLGNVYKMQSKFDSAKYFIEESIRIDDQQNCRSAVVQISKIELADIYLNLNDFQKAMELIYQVEHDKRTIKGNDFERIMLEEYWNLLKKNYYFRLNKLDSAYFYQTRYHKVSDSFYKAKNDLLLSDMESAFASRNNQYHISLLAKDNQLKKDALTMIIALTGMILIILYIVWNNLKRSKMNGIQLNNLNQQISNQNFHLQNTLNSLEQSQADNTQLMKVVAHDLRNPIGAITMCSQLMLGNPGRPEEDIKLLEIMKRSGENSLNLVSNLLETNNRSENLIREPVDLKSMLEYCVGMLVHKARKKDQQIVLDAEPLTLSVSREKLWRVLSNLIANAVKFSPSNTSIMVSMRADGSHALITVKDQGIGIPDEWKGRIFEMFTEAQRTGTGGEKPFGMGLAICRQIVLAHGGDIWFESNPNNGTSFYVRLPAV